MTRVTKGEKAGKPRLVCTKAKKGAGCEYVSVPLHQVHHALIAGADTLRNPPLVDEDLGDQIKAANLELFQLGEQIETLVDNIERSPSPALSKRLASREAEADAVRGQLKALEARATDSESRIVKHRAGRLADALTAFGEGQETAELLAAANSALRECMDSIVIEYQTGQLRLQWRHGAGSALLYGSLGFSKVSR
jgi:hypothetical protein